MTAPLHIGTTISHYRILSRLGSGGMGEVYLAEYDTIRAARKDLGLVIVDSLIIPDFDRGRGRWR